MTLHRLFAAAALGLAVAAAPVAALAHARLVASTPAAGTTAASPERMSLTPR
jgi:methionine-rich copper-binding protein CopC